MKELMKQYDETIAYRRCNRIEPLEERELAKLQQTWNLPDESFPHLGKRGWPADDPATTAQKPKHVPSALSQLIELVRNPRRRHSK